MLASGWLEKTRENVDPVESGRPARYHYKLSERGTIGARRELAALYQELSPAPRCRGALRPEGGRA
jgi:hypothetical protein